MLPSANPSRQRKRHLDRFSHFCTAILPFLPYHATRFWFCTDRGRVSLGMSGHALPLKIAPVHGEIWTASNTRFLGSTRLSIPNGISIGSVALHSSRSGRPVSPPKKSLPMGDLDFHLIHTSLGPTESTNLTASRSVQRFLQGPRDRRPTDHATRSVTIGCIYVRINVVSRDLNP